MKNKKEVFKLPIHFDFTNEIIYKSTAVIIFGLAYLFAANLLRFNYYSVFFALLFFLFVYFKRSSYIKIENNTFQLIYFQYYQAEKINVNQIVECIFYKSDSLVELQIKDEKKIQFHLKEKNKEKLLDLLVTWFPEITPVFIENTKKNS